ncbi:MAG: SRPBCC domain-containing protein [Steroidobacteraceae bacterium]
MAGKLRGYAHRIDIEADTARVWRAFTEPKALARWCAPGSAIKPRAGGSFRASVDRINTIDAHIDVFDAQRRLRLIHLERPDLPASDLTLIDDFLLEADGKATIVRLLGSGFPEDPAWDPYYLRLRAGWERALARLKVYLEKNMDKEAK